MDDRDATDPYDRSPECQHQRLLERVLDAEGRKTDNMKCCECGGVVQASQQKPSY